MLYCDDRPNEAFALTALEPSAAQECAIHQLIDVARRIIGIRHIQNAGDVPLAIVAAKHELETGGDTLGQRHVGTPTQMSISLTR